MTDRLRSFVAAFSLLIDRHQRDEACVLDEGRALLADLVGHDDWLPDALAVAGGNYSQYLLYLDPGKRFSVVSFAWGPGQATPIHDHTVWGLVGVLRGAEFDQSYSRGSFGMIADGPPVRIEPGDVVTISPRTGDIHRVCNAFGDRVSVSIHVYGADIGTLERSSFTAAGSRRAFVSGYTAVVE